MKVRVIAAACCAATVALGTTGCSSSSSGARPASSSTTVSTPVTVPSGSPREYVAHRADWVLPGRDYDNSRATFDSSINAADVDGLRPEWTADMSGGLTTVPLIVGDTIYVQDGAGVVAAFNRANGKTRWKSKGYGLNIGPFGVAIADGRLFADAGASSVVALDAATGKQLWLRKVTTTPSMGIDIQPTAFAGSVIVSTVPVSVGGIYNPGDRGTVHALDAKTGKDRWAFATVPAGLWGHPEINSGGGAWYPPAIDTQRRLVFGRLRWYHQVHPHDLFDRDLVHTLIAHPTPTTSVVVGMGKGGVVVGLDPASGKLLWSTPVGTHHNDQLTKLAGPTEVLPGTYGGVLTPPATADGVVYVASINAPTKLAPTQTAYIGSELGSNDGVVTAINAASGKVLWHTTVKGDPLGGATVINDLVLTALLDGTIVVLRRDTGKLVKTIKADGGINGWMSAAGDQIIVPVGNASKPHLVAYAIH